MAKDHELRMTAEAQKRTDAVEQMGQMMEGITERLNEQQENMEKTCKENEQLRSQLGKVDKVLLPSRTIAQACDVLLLV